MRRCVPVLLPAALVSAPATTRTPRSPAAKDAVHTDRLLTVALAAAALAVPLGPPSGNTWAEVWDILASPDSTGE